MSEQSKPSAELRKTVEELLDTMEAERQSLKRKRQGFLDFLTKGSSPRAHAVVRDAETASRKIAKPQD